MAKKTKRNLVLETNRRLQETSQKLFMAKQELERRNRVLGDEIDALKHLAGPKIEKDITLAPGKKLTTSIAEGLSLKYIAILRTYLDIKNLKKQEQRIEELCRDLMKYNIAPKGIIDIHLKAMPQVGTIGGLETKRITVETRMVLLAVMTKYADLLRQKKGG